MLTLLTVDECTGLDCPLLSLPWFFMLYLIVMILTCCCCYPGACACPQRQVKRDRQTGKPNMKQRPWHSQLNLLGSIGQVLSSEWAADEVVDPIEDENTDEGGEFGTGEESQLKRRKRIRY